MEPLRKRVQNFIQFPTFRLVQGKGEKFTPWFDRIFAIDTRSLAAFRVGLGALVLLDLLMRAQNLSVFHADAGVVPRSALLQHSLNNYHLSLHIMSGQGWFQGLLFLAHAIFGVGLLIGYRTRLCALMCWALLVSLHTRNPVILQAGDTELRMLLFFGLFLPLGAKFSLDGSRTEEEFIPARWLSLPSVLLLLQVALIYWAGSLEKHSPNWRTTHTAVFDALSIDQMATRLGVWMRQFPDFLSVVTVGVYWWEALAPLLLLSPWPKPRILGVVGFWALHFGFWTGLNIGLFPYISACGVIPFIPGWFWDKLEARGVLERIKNRIPTKLLNLWEGATQRLPVARFHFKRRAWHAVFTATCFACILAWTSKNVFQFPKAIPEPIRAAVFSLRLDQRWDMFAPRPLTTDGWYVIPGRTVGNAEVDVWHGKLSPVSWLQPTHVADEYVNHRWQKYMMNLRSTRYKDYRLYFGRYLCRTWNETHEGKDKLAGFEIDFMSRDALPNRKFTDRKKITLWKHQCSSGGTGANNAATAPEETTESYESNESLPVPGFKDFRHPVQIRK